MRLILLQGPAGSGKSALAAQMLAAGEVGIYGDVTALWAAISGAVRDPLTGRYPVRDPDDIALEAARYIQRVLIRFGLEHGADVVVTTSQRGQENSWRAWADRAGAAFEVRTVDPGRDVVAARLADDDGSLSAECEQAIGRWYG